MTEQITAEMTALDLSGQPTLPKRNGPKGLLPGSGVSGARVEYCDASGRGQTMSGKLLDTFPTGVVMGANGCHKLISWDALVFCELVEG
jgi:hypothetical protein